MRRRFKLVTHIAILLCLNSAADGADVDVEAGRVASHSHTQSSSTQRFVAIQQRNTQAHTRMLSSQRSGCGSWLELEGQCYFLAAQPASMPAARALCRRTDEWADLASFSSGTSFADLSSILTDSTEYWVGARLHLKGTCRLLHHKPHTGHKPCTSTDNSWRWLNGSHIPANWAAGLGHTHVEPVALLSYNQGAATTQLQHQGAYRVSSSGCAIHSLDLLLLPSQTPS